MRLSTTDHIALGDLVDRYASYADARRTRDLAALFTADAELVAPGPPHTSDPHPHRGRDGVLSAMEPLNALRASLHAVVGRVFDPGDGTDLAHGRVSCIAHHLSAADDGSLRDVVWHLHYDDDYLRVDRTWRFRRRVITVDWTEVRPAR